MDSDYAFTAFGVSISASIVCPADEPTLGCESVERNVLNYPRNFS